MEWSEAENEEEGGGGGGGECLPLKWLQSTSYKNNNVYL